LGITKSPPNGSESQPHPKRNPGRFNVTARCSSAGATEMEIAAITGHAVGDVRSIMDKCYFNRDPAMAVRAMQKLEKGTKSANRPANRPR